MNAVYQIGCTTIWHLPKPKKHLMKFAFRGWVTRKSDKIVVNGKIHVVFALSSRWHDYQFTEISSYGYQIKLLWIWKQNMILHLLYHHDHTTIRLLTHTYIILVIERTFRLTAFSDYISRMTDVESIFMNQKVLNIFNLAFMRKILNIGNSIFSPFSYLYYTISRDKVTRMVLLKKKLS